MLKMRLRQMLQISGYSAGLFWSEDEGIINFSDCKKERYSTCHQDYEYPFIVLEGGHFDMHPFEGT